MSFKAFVRDIGLIGIAEITVTVGLIILIPLLTKTLGAYGYGLWQQVIVTMGILGPITSFGLNNAIVRFLPAKKTVKEKQDIFYSVLLFKFVTTSLVAALLLVFSDTIAVAFFDGAANIVMLTGVIFIITSASALCQFYFRSLRQIKKYAVLRIVGQYSEIGLAYYMILAGYGIFGAIASFLVIRTIIFIISLSVIIAQIGVRFPNFTEMKTWLRYGIPLIPTGISAWVVDLSDRYVIGYMIGVSLVGVYSVGYTVGFFFFMAMSLINVVLVPALSKLFDEGKLQEVKTYLKYVLKYYLLLAIPIVFGLMVLSKPILSIFTTPAIAEEAWIIAPIVAVAALCAGVYEVFDKSLRLTKKTTRIGLVITISAGVNLSLNLILIPVIGILGAAVATVTAFSVSMVCMIFFSIKEIRFDIEKLFIGKSIGASLVMAGIGWMWDPIGLLSLLACVGTCITVYFIVVFLLRGLSTQEIRFILTSLRFKER